MLEQNIQMALSQKDISLEDAIDIREIHNLKMANQLLKVKRKQQEAEQQAQAAATTNASSTCKCKRNKLLLKCNAE